MARTFWLTMRNLIVLFMVVSIAYLPVMGNVESAIAAMSTGSTTPKLTCSAYSPNVVNDVAPHIEGMEETDADTGDITNIVDSAVFIPEEIVSGNVFYSDIKTYFDKVGIYDAAKKGWNLCTIDYNRAVSFVPVWNSDIDYFDTLTMPYPRLQFQNSQDLYALSGEPCRKFIANNQCDETQDEEPVAIIDPATGQAMIEKDSAGNPVYVNGQPKLVYQTDLSGHIITEKKYKYFDDVGWPNGHWDAPKADVRILKTLVYLATPTNQGGAGRDRIKIGKVIQISQKNKEFPSTSTDTAAAANTTSTTGSTSGALSSADPAETDEEDTKTISSHYADTSNPSHPTTISQALDITEIDSVRMTTRVTKKKRLGGSSVSYTYKSYPIKVAWQSKEGEDKAGVPPVDIFNGAQVSWNTTFLELLDEMDIDTSDIDATSVSLDNLGDLASLVGQSLLSHLMNSPSGSLEGWDVTSLLDRLGRMYLANQLGLDPQAFLTGNSVDDVIDNIGRAKVESIIGLPSGSLMGSEELKKAGKNEYDSATLLANIGRRYLEEKIFKVSDGTLLSTPDAPITDHDSLLIRLGQGRIEKRFKLPSGSMRVNSATKAKVQTVNDARKTSYKANHIFVNDGDTNQYVDNALLDEDLHLAAVSSTTNMDGYSASDLANPTADVVSQPNSSGAWMKYLRIIGSRVIESGIGSFNSKLTNGQEWGDYANTNNFGDYFLGTVLGVNVDVLKIAKRKTRFGDYDAQRYREILTSTINQALSSDNAKLFTSSPINLFTPAELRQFVTDLANWTADYDPQYYSYSPTVAQARVIYNTINSTDQANLGWRTRFQLKLTKLEGISVEELQRDENEGERLSNQLDQMREYMNEAQNMISSFSDAILRQQSVPAQSGRSSAANIPSNAYQINSDGTQSNVGLNPSNSDPLNAIVSGDLRSMPYIGKVYLSSLTTNNSTAQNKLISQLSLNNLKNFSTQINNLTTLGITDILFQNKGLLQGDFERIFEYSMGKQVFQRIGQTELLRTAWNQSGLNNTVKGALSSSVDLASVQRQINQLSQDFTFYQSRLNILAGSGGLIQKIINEASNAGAEVSDAVAALSSVRVNTAGSDILAIQYDVSKYETALNGLAQCVGTNGACTQLKGDVEDAQHVIQEIITGHPLDFNQGVDISHSSSMQNDGCWTGADIRSIFSKQKLITSFSSFAISIASCRVDASLNLPGGTINRWMNSGAIDNYDSLAISVGLAASNSSVATKEILSLGSDDAKYKYYRTYGEQLLIADGVSAITSLMPGLKQLTGKYNITGKDIFNLLHGKTENVVAKIGGSIFDDAFHWDPGTSADLIMPTCYQENKPRIAAYTKPCTASEAQSIRLTTMAQIGLRELGVEIGFPTSFRIDSRGNFFQNYGNSSISEALGLSANSFTGYFTEMVSRNDPQVVKLAFGLNDTPVDTAVQKLRDAYLAAQSGSAMDTSAIPGVLELINQYQVDKLTGRGSIADPNSSYWNFTNFNQREAHFIASSGNTYGQQLAGSDYDGFTALLTSIKDYIAGHGESPAEMNALLTKYGVIRGSPDRDSYVSSFTKAYTHRIEYFRFRVDQLDHQFRSASGTYGLTLTALNSDGTVKLVGGVPQLGDMEQYVRGAIKAESITEKAGLGVLDPILDALNVPTNWSQIFGDSSITDVLGLFTELTKSPTCSSGLTPRSLIMGISVGGRHGCTFAGVGSMSLSKLISTDPQYAQARTYFFDHFLSRIFSAKLESKIGLDPGTFRNMVMQPGKAEEIAISQGIRIIADQLFGKDSRYTNDQNAESQMRKAFREAFMVGFFDTKTNTYTLNFNLNRSIGSLRDSLDGMLVRLTGRIFGTPNQAISTQDLHAIIGGDTNTLAYLGAEYLINQVNEKVENRTCSDCNSRTLAARKEEMKIDYMSIRAAFNLPLLTPKEKELMNLRGQVDYIRAQSGSDLDWMTGKTDQEIISEYKIRTNQGEEANSTLEYHGSAAVKKFEDDTYKRGKEVLQYSIYDSIAFATLDPNIPKGFTYAMLKGNTATKLAAIGTYAIGALGLDKSLFGGFLTPEEITNVLTFVANGFKNVNGNDLNMRAMGALDRWATGRLEKLIGISGLPDGLMTSFFAWGATGFSPKFFDTSAKITTGPFVKVPAFGYLLKDWGITKVCNWADKTLKLPSGSAYSIYSSYKAYAAARKAGDAAKIRTSAADMISTVINIVFSKQIGQAEQALGLVPGTGSIAVGMLVSLAMGAPVAPLTIALFVGINLFGVYKVVIDIQASPDGYYPFTGIDGVPRMKPYEYDSPDPHIGSFDAKNPVTYRDGLMRSAQLKVQGLIGQLLEMPSSWGVDVLGGKTEDLWIAQIFTYREQDIKDLSYLIDRPAPWECEGCYGYGEQSKRGTVSWSESLNNYIVTPYQNYRAGVFADKAFWNHIHISWGKPAGTPTLK